MHIYTFYYINNRAEQCGFGTFSLQLSSTSVLIRLSQLSVKQAGSLQHQQRQKLPLKLIDQTENMQFIDTY